MGFFGVLFFGELEDQKEPVLNFQLMGDEHAL